VISSTLLTLIVVPAVYSLVESSEVSLVSRRWNTWRTLARQNLESQD
jgi:hypothetical protein